MARILLAPVIALGATLLTSDESTAWEPPTPATGFTMTLAGKGTAAEAATSVEDTEEACCWRRRYYGCYGGYGYSSYYGGFGYGGGYSTFNSYRPFYRPYVFRPFYRPHMAVNFYSSNYNGGFGGFGGGYYSGINGTREDADAPVISLGLAAAKNPLASAPRRTQQATESLRAYSYDGGPANPVPQVKPDPSSQRAVSATAGLPVSLKKEIARPYRYKAYGEK